MMLNLYPTYGRDFGPGWCMFQASRSALGAAIAIKTDPGGYLRGRLVPNHVGTVLNEDEVGESLSGGYTISPLAPLLDPDNRDTVVWFREPSGLTPAAAELMIVTARTWADGDLPYNFGGIGGLAISDATRPDPAPNPLSSPWAAFCSQAYVLQLLTAARLFSRPLPQALRQVPSDRWTPDGLDKLAVLWA
ncbi:MAG: hypothetical protein LDL07_06185 [Desulfarculus sp.]|nr:hypothetical protein [Desulfarculus sp.]